MAPLRRTVGLLTLAFVLGGFAFAVATPMFQNPDEATHLDMARHYAYETTDLAGPELRVSPSVRAAAGMVGLLEGHYLGYENVPERRPRYPELTALPRPGQEWGCAVSSPTCQNYQYAHPPGFYLALAPLVWVLERPLGLGFPTELVILRMVGVLLAAPVVALTAYTATVVWPGSELRPVAAAAVVAFAGPVVANAAMVNNDAATLLLGGIAVAVLARLLRRPPRLARLSLLLGGVVGLGLLVKATFLPFAVVGGVGVLVAAGPAGWRTAVRAAVAYGLPASVGGLWWLRNLVRDGSLTPAGSEILAPERQGPGSEASFAGYVWDHLPTLVSRAWGNYGWRTVEVGPAWRWGLSIGAVVLAAGWLLGRRWQRPSPDGLRVGLVFAAVPAALALAALWASYDVFVSTGEEARGLVGRYVYPSFPVLALGAVAAAAAVVRRLSAGERAARGALAGGLAGWAVVATGGSFVLAVHGLYRTRDLGLLLDRAAVVAPVPAPAAWLGLLFLAWWATVLTAVWQAASRT